jgi:hypothetical protein
MAGRRPARWTMGKDTHPSSEPLPSVPVRMFVPPPPIFCLPLTVYPCVVAIPLVPFFRQPMTVSGVFAGIPVVVVLVLAIIVAPGFFVVIVIVQWVKSLRSYRDNQGSAQEKRGQTSLCSLHMYLL